ncbi:hypothetical protein LMG26411_07938 [Cupriavidus numazuensis]|uniref:Transposase n=1 Tax=Cupriavidus numazuensis TaxID=221992 RepID=A0ABM8TW86_9BURK|nr:hypothetical protein LMG26411_07938 [Cupriavidus numazuensis]
MTSADRAATLLPRYIDTNQKALHKLQPWLAVMEVCP